MSEQKDITEKEKHVKMVESSSNIEETKTSIERSMKRRSQACNEDGSFCLTPGCRNHLNESKKRKIQSSKAATPNLLENGIFVAKYEMGEWSLDNSPFTCTSQPDIESNNASPPSRFQAPLSPSFFEELRFEDNSDNSLTLLPYEADKENIPPGMCTPESSLSATPSPFGCWMSTPEPSSLYRWPRRTLFPNRDSETPFINRATNFAERKRLFGVRYPMEKKYESKISEVDCQQIKPHPKLHVTRSSPEFYSVPPLPLHYPLNDMSPRDVAKKLLKKANEDVKHRSMEDMTDELIKELGKPQNTSSPRTWPQCVICLENEADTVVFRCGHLCMCSECSKEQWLGHGQGTCPICRNSIQQLLHPH